MTANDDPFSQPPKGNGATQAANAPAAARAVPAGGSVDGASPPAGHQGASGPVASQPPDSLLSVLDACLEVSSSGPDQAVTPAVCERELAELTGRVNQNALYAATISLFVVVNQLRNSWVLIDVTDLRQRTINAINGFEQRARAAGYSNAVVQTAQYCLCAAIDEAALSTEWGISSAWSRQTLTYTFYNETSGGETFFTKLDQVVAQIESRTDHADVKALVDLLEIFYVCLALGFNGKYRVLNQGLQRLNEQRRAVYLLIQKQRGAIEDELSPNWRITEVASRQRKFLPAWLTVVMTLVFLLAVYFALSYHLNERSDVAFANVQSIGRAIEIKLERTAPAVGKTAPRKPVKVETIARPAPIVKRKLPWWQGFNGFLEDEIRRNVLEVIDNKDAVVIRVFNKGLFPSASATVAEGYRHVFQRIGSAIEAKVPGAVTVIGHSDNRPLRNSLRFPSNWHLSTARAQAVAKAILPSLSDPKRVTFEGRSDTEPLASNATPQGRAANRRVEIYLRKMVSVADDMPAPTELVVPRLNSWDVRIEPGNSQ